MDTHGLSAQAPRARNHMPLHPPTSSTEDKTIRPHSQPTAHPLNTLRIAQALGLLALDLSPILLCPPFPWHPQRLVPSPAEHTCLP